MAFARQAPPLTGARCGRQGLSQECALPPLGEGFALPGGTRQRGRDRTSRGRRCPHLRTGEALRAAAPRLAAAAPCASLTAPVADRIIAK